MILGIVDRSFWEIILQIQELEISIKRIQARIRFLRKNILKNQNLKVTIESLKQKINNLLQSEDDWLTVYYSEARYLPKKANHYH